MKLGSKLGIMINTYCDAHGIPYAADEGEAFFDQLRGDMVVGVGGAGESLPQVSLPLSSLLSVCLSLCLSESMLQAVQRMWTSFRQLRGREFCTILNEVLRYDTAGEPFSDSLADSLSLSDSLSLTLSQTSL